MALVTPLRPTEGGLQTRLDFSSIKVYACSTKLSNAGFANESRTLRQGFSLSWEALAAKEQPIPNQQAAARARF
jgi:hypothetical protein